MSLDKSLRAGLSQRHLTMMSIAGVIGAGLFVGSGKVIAMAGPATILAYMLGAALVVLVMRMLGEMAVASPDTGSFSTYAERAIGPWAGFTIGWLYWWFWVLVLPLEANVAGIILHAWIPGVPVWVFALVLTALLTLTNLFDVRSYGEFEFWFGLIKVVAIIGFIAIGGLAILNLLPSSQVHGLAALTPPGGFMPNGFGAVLAAMLSTMFIFLGAEIVTLAASESANPGRQIVRATHSVVWRICLFYIGSIFIIVALVPWDDPLLPQVGAYRRTLELIGIPYVKPIIDFVVLTSVASCFNSSLYTASRMLYSLSRRGEGPQLAARLGRNGSPQIAVLVSSAIGLVAVAANYTVPEQVFGTLMNTTGAIALMVYLVIAISQLSMRRRLESTGHQFELKMWLFPWLTLGVIAFVLAVLALMMIRPDHRDEVVGTAALACLIVLIGVYRQCVRTRATVVLD